MFNLKKKVVALTVAASSILISSPVFAEGEKGENPFDTVGSSVEDATGSFTNLGFIIAVVMLVISGIALMLSQKAREWAKGHIFYVIIGIVVIVLASQAVAYVQSLFGG
ncbi:TPA: TrbC/VirB2 family protein [Streptococcus suis]